MCSAGQHKWAKCAKEIESDLKQTWHQGWYLKYVRVWGGKGWYEGGGGVEGKGIGQT